MPDAIETMRRECSAEEIARRRRAVNVLVLTGLGLNCQTETAEAFRLVGSTPRLVHLLDLLEGRERLDFRDGRSRYEEATDDHHDHLIDIESGNVIEFQSEEIERLQREIARKLGYDLVDHRLELYAVPRKGKK